MFLELKEIVIKLIKLIEQKGKNEENYFIIRERENDCHEWLSSNSIPIIW